MILALASTVVAGASASPRLKAGAIAKCTGAPATLNLAMGSSPGLTFPSDVPIFESIGWFERECHTTVNYVYLAAGAAQQAALDSGAVQYLTGSNDIGTELSDIEAGEDNDIALNNNALGSQEVFFAPIKYKSFGVGINALGKFANLTWGVPSTSGSGNIYDNAILKHDGVNPSSVRFLIIGPNGAAAALAGECQLCASAATVALPLIQTGQFYAVWYSSGLQAYNLVHLVGNAGLVGLRSYVETHKSMTQYLVAAEIRGTEMARADYNKPATVYATYPPAAQAAVPYSAFLEAWPFNLGDLAVSGLLTHSMLQYLANEDYNYRVLSTPLKVPTDALTTSFYDNAFKLLGQTAPTTALLPADLSWLYNKSFGIKA
jgi:hypothetical protein